MPSSFELLKKQLDDTVGLIESTCVAEQTALNLPAAVDERADTQSLIARCESVCDKYQPKRPTIRIIHHLACSGGTLISKCISAMPNVYLLSEVHPTQFAKNEIENICFSPTNIPLQSFYAGVPDIEKLCEKLFLSNVKLVHEHCEKIGADLVLRDHSHSDFTSDNAIYRTSKIIDVLSQEFDIISLVTLRDPAESFSSLQRNAWVRFEPASFEEYCKRVFAFLSYFNTSQIFTYESFVENPSVRMATMCEALDIKFNDCFEYIFDCAKVTGDSGRGGSIIERRPVNLTKEVELTKASSASYKKILEQYYKINL
ncbi:hypothetical protein [Vibrio rotiferianus]|uniref:hypothetical protein n=1 Tax=Vibrio rotiferianus TaxID=190895 RepID=UPI002893A505|nr:conserved hypothetical protein [Vibrio rotiferianus]